MNITSRSASGNGTGFNSTERELLTLAGREIAASRLSLTMKLRPVAVAAALVGTLAAPHGLAQGNGQYLALLDSYATGEPTEAATALAAWPEDRVRAAVRTLDAQTAHDRARTAVMLHTETAFDETADGRESFHVDVARSFLRDLLDSPLRPDPATRDFAGRWHALVAVLYCANNDEGRARQEINHGLTLDSKHKYVNLVAGALVEYRVAQEEPNLRGDWNVRLERDYILKKLLHQAAQGYRDIVANHLDFFEARLRLGWVLTLNDSLQNAREQLEVVAARATSSDVLYLARMFLASLHERANRPADAAREYEAARAVAPYQSSLIALIRIAAAVGREDQVRSLADEIPAMAADQEDPWSFYTSCVTGGDLFEGLRAEARMP